MNSNLLTISKVTAHQWVVFNATTNQVALCGEVFPTKEAAMASIFEQLLLSDLVFTGSWATTEGSGMLLVKEDN